MVASTSGRLAGFGAALAPPPVARRVEGSLHRPARLQKLCAAGRPESLSRTANTRGRPAAQALDGPLLFAAEAEDEDSLDPAVDRLSREASGPTSRWFANSGKAHTYEVLRVEASGATELQELKRRELLRRTGLPARDLRRIDPALSLTTSAPSLLVSDQVLLINLGQVRLIVANDHALLFEPRSPTARHFLEGLLSRLRLTREAAASSCGDDEALPPGGEPFELEVVEAALLEVTGQLDTLLLDASARTAALLRVLPQRLAITAEVLEELRLVKQSLVELDSRAGAIRSMLLEVLDDPEDIRGMRLEFGEGGAAARGLAPPPSAEELEDAEDEVENILEYYLQRCETAHGEAERLLENTRDLEESISVSLSARRFEVNKLELSLSIATFATAVGALVAGIFGMNLKNRFEMSTAAFYGTSVGIVVGVVCLCVCLLNYTRKKRIL